MEKEFNLEILTPGKPLLKTTVSEVVLPAFDGEMGVLPGHEDFIGILGTGALKLVKDGDDYWFMVSSGVFEIKKGNLVLLAEFGEDGKNINDKLALIKVKELEPLISNKSLFSDDFAHIKSELDRAKARLEVHRRTELVN